MNAFLLDSKVNHDIFNFILINFFFQCQIQERVRTYRLFATSRGLTRLPTVMWIYTSLLS